MLSSALASLTTKRASLLLLLPALAAGCFVTLAPCAPHVETVLHERQKFSWENGNLQAQCGDAPSCIGSAQGMYDVEMDWGFCKEAHWEIMELPGPEKKVRYRNLRSLACLAGMPITEGGGALSQAPCSEEETNTLWSDCHRPVEGGGACGVGAYTRLDVLNATGPMCLTTLPSRAEVAAGNINQLWHPYFLMYFVQVVGHLITTAMSIKYPKALIGLVLGTGLVYPLSFFCNIKTWTYAPGDSMWITLFLKWIIVDLLATVPVLYIKAFDVTERQIHIVALFVYGILGTNVITTLLLSKPYIVMTINNCTAVTLTVSLILQCLAVSKHPKMELFTKSKNGLIFGFATPFCWLVCYSIWNGLFIASFTAGGTIQVILFWLMMFYYWCQDSPRRPIEFYFAYARPVELGTFIGISELCGTLVPYFKNAIALDKQSPILINSHAYFFFITTMNFIFSIIVLVWAFQQWSSGIQDYPTQRTFEEEADTPASSIEMMAAESQS